VRDGREDAGDRVAEFRGLLEMHRDAGSVLARQLLSRKGRLGEEVWLIEPIDTAPMAAPPASPVETSVAQPQTESMAARA